MPSCELCLNWSGDFRYGFQDYLFPDCIDDFHSPYLLSEDEMRNPANCFLVSLQELEHPLSFRRYWR